MPSDDRRARRRWLWWGGFLVMTVLVVLALRGVDWDRVWTAVRRARPTWLALAVAGNALILPLAAWQWMWLVPGGARVGFGEMFWIRAVTSTVANGGPFLGGYAATVHLVAKRTGIGYGRAVSFKALEQVAEGFAKLVVVGSAVLVAPLPRSFRVTALVLVVAVPALAALAGFGAGRRRILERWAARRRGWRRSLAEFAGRASEGLEAVRRPRVLAAALALGVAQKVAEGLALAAVLAALEVTVPLSTLLLVLAAVNLSTMISVTPANLGIYEGAAFLAYRATGVDGGTALALSVLQHAAYLIPMAGAGWILLAERGLESL